jgi:hypothetical protein
MFRLLKRFSFSGCSYTTTFDDLFIRAFFNWGLLVHCLRWPLFLGPFVLTAFLGVGFKWIEQQVMVFGT